MRTRMYGLSGVAALLAALVLGSWSLASATSLDVDGGVVHYWELDADLPAADPASEPEPDGAAAESDESQDLPDPGVVEGPTSLPAPTVPSQPETPPSEPEGSEPTTSAPTTPVPTVPEPTTAETESAPPAEPSAPPESETAGAQPAPSTDPDSADD